MRIPSQIRDRENAASHVGAYPALHATCCDGPAAILSACACRCARCSLSSRRGASGEEKFPPLTTTFLGQADDGELAVAVVQTNDALLVFSCGDATNYATRTGWFTTHVLGAGAFAADAGGVHVSGTVLGDGAVGTFVEPDGARVSWAARLAYRPPYDSGGLFSVIDDGCRTGVIVRQRTSYDNAVSVQGVWCSTVNGTTTYLPLTALDTPDANASHLRVQVDSRSGARVVDVPRVDSAE